MYEIERVDAWEVLDSRGDPTLRTRVSTAGAQGTFTVPSGASTGRHEVMEVRDGEPRYGGKGVRRAVELVRETLAPEVVGLPVIEQQRVDRALVEVDGNESEDQLVGNAVLGVSGATLRAASASQNQPLHTYLADGSPGRLPMPMVNILSGGLHAQGGLNIQDFLVVPTRAETFSGALEKVWSVRDAVRERILREGHRPLVADEGGYSPPLPDVDSAFQWLRDAVRDAGHEPATDDVAFAVDVASTHFYEVDSGTYRIKHRDHPLSSREMVEEVIAWVKKWPIVSVEDPLAEDDWDGWKTLVGEVGDQVQILADDLTATTPERLRRVKRDKAANAVLVKPNQTGTVSRTLSVLDGAQRGDMNTVVSARSGETCDSTIADLAVGRDAGQIKIGSLARSERLAKYNRLLEIERRLESELAHPFADVRTGS